MASITWSALSRAARTAARSAAEAAAAGLVAAGAAIAIWGGTAGTPAIAAGLACAWLASTASATWLLAAKEAGGTKAFWWAFGGGMTLRLATLAALMVYSVRRADWSQPALLLAYAFGVLFFLLLEYRHVKLGAPNDIRDGAGDIDDD